MFRSGGLFAFAIFLCTANAARAADRNVSSAQQLRDAIENAVAGDAILVAPGVYRFDASIWTHHDGAPGRPITVRAEKLGEVRFDFHSGEGLVINNAHWTLDRLWINAACDNPQNCETGIGVKPPAHHFLLLHSRTTDWYQHVKSSRETDLEVEDAAIVGNELYNTGTRYSQVIDIVGGKRWRIIGNYVHDWNGSGNGAFGIFLKGGTSDGVIEQNLVICEKDRPSTGAMVGISLGQGGTGGQWCANGCACEDTNGIVRNNIVAHCSDAGLHALKSCGGKFYNNTVYDTLGGLQIQEDSNMAPVEIRNNVIGGRVFGGTNYVASNNLLEVDDALFAEIYANPAQGNFADGDNVARARDLGVVLPEVTADYCGTLRQGTFDFGAIEFPAGCSTWPWDAERMATFDPLDPIVPVKPLDPQEMLVPEERDQAGELRGSCACVSSARPASPVLRLSLMMMIAGLFALSLRRRSRRDAAP